MKTEKITVADLFDKPRRYLIPLFQRGYVWTREDQWQPLWDDIVYQVARIRDGRARSDDYQQKHFLGAVVLNQTQLGVRHTPVSDVIDGQQRLTTLQLLLLAFRDAVSGLDNAFLSAPLRRLTENPEPWPDEQERFKVWPTSAFQRDFRSVAVSGSAAGVNEAFPARYIRRKLQPRPGIVEAYAFFANAITTYLTKDQQPLEGSATAQSPPSPTLDEERAEDLLLAITRHLQLVEILLDGEDDPQIIFETLNARGAPLKPSDLIRNFVFLYATRRKENVAELYETHWQTFDDLEEDTARARAKAFWKQEERQGRLKTNRLDLFIYHYLTCQTESDIKLGQIFQEFKIWWESSPTPRVAADELAILIDAAGAYRSLLQPEDATRWGIFAGRLRTLDISTLYPVLLALHMRRDELPAQEFDGILTDLESYVVRRAVCGLTPKNYNRTFLILLKEIHGAAELTRKAVQRQLLTFEGESSVWPNDDIFERHFHSAPLYERLNWAKTRMLLEAIERGLRTNKQEVLGVSGSLTIEHVWPQHPREGAWPTAPLREDGSPDWEEELRVSQIRHSIGNLTLVTQAFNSALSNGPFADKRHAIVRESLLKLNKYFHDIPDSEWNEGAIRARAASLFVTAREIWPYSADAIG